MHKKLASWKNECERLEGREEDRQGEICRNGELTH